ncbi:MAG: VanZ family protein [Bacteroidetes bacterium]|jgi:VanZ family protein|nr:VanZ family protein [Bacteroidota bacterium]MBT6686046.1 VanZ family protein [Bacteroidota bacterium]MBT7142734.1 VanZ family protein [Bacteroidota bacterium]MBT7491325.1 VanZ family protein [Bacteroidota bacterium]
MVKPFWKVVFATIIIFILSAIPGNVVKEPIFWNADKLIHFGMYLIYSILLIAYFEGQFKYSKLHNFPLTYALIFAVSYGAILEILQEFVFVHRSGSFADAIANSVGAIVGVIFYRRF